jgi:response regulator RpfG family c-di-GMP phosphodiesterase
MSNLVQGNPELWAVAGDLIVQNMDWPGADKLAERLKRTIDPKLLSDQQSPETLQMQKQMEELQQTNDQMRKMLENVQSSFEHQELMIKEYEAETKRISAVQAGMSPEQIQDIVMGTIQGMMDVGDLAGKPTGLINNTPPEQPMQTAQPQQGEI